MMQEMLCICTGVYLETCSQNGIFLQLPSRLRVWVPACIDWSLEDGSEFLDKFKFAPAQVHGSSCEPNEWSVTTQLSNLQCCLLMLADCCAPSIYCKAATTQAQQSQSYERLSSSLLLPITAYIIVIVTV